MDEHLLKLLNYDGVLMVLVTTNDGLVVGAAGLGGDDAEIVAAAGSSLVSAMAMAAHGEISVPVDGGGVLHIVHGDELHMITLTEPEIPHDAVRAPMEETLAVVLEHIS